MHSTPSVSCRWKWRHSTLVQSSEDYQHCTRAWGKSKHPLNNHGFTAWSISLAVLWSAIQLVAVIHKTRFSPFLYILSTCMEGAVLLSSSFLPGSPGNAILNLCRLSLPSLGQKAFIYHRTFKGTTWDVTVPNSTLQSPCVVLSLSRRRASVQLCHTGYTTYKVSHSHQEHAYNYEYKYILYYQLELGK